MNITRTFSGAAALAAAAAAVVVGASPASASPAPASYHNGYLRQGNPTAKVVVTVTEDYACPSCKYFESLSGSTLSDFANGGKVGVDYRAIALIDRNYGGRTTYSARSASAAACVAEGDRKAWPTFHRVLFERQPQEGTAGLTDTQLVDIAKQAGATSPAVASCITSEKYRPFVDATTNTAFTQIKGTPTVLVNGKQVDQPTPANLRAAVAQAEAATK